MFIRGIGWQNARKNGMMKAVVLTPMQVNPPKISIGSLTKNLLTSKKRHGYKVVGRVDHTKGIGFVVRLATATTGRNRCVVRSALAFNKTVHLPHKHVASPQCEFVRA